MSVVKPSPRVDRKLQLREVLDWLVEDGLAESAAAAKVLEDSRVGRGGTRHPFVAIGESRLPSRKTGQALNPETLTEWLAARLKMPYYHIDPLNIDLKGVTAVMSSEYAQRRAILPVEVNGKEVTIATSEPFVTAWERELTEMLAIRI